MNWMKWPAAVLAAVATPLMIWALVRLAQRIAVGPTLSLIPFGAGIVAMVVVWRRWMGGRLGNYLITLEHELTHALFAWLTLHRLTGFRATLRRGGQVQFQGHGNWLITAAPYFFPTAAIALFLLAYLLPLSILPWHSFLLGVALAYHVISTRYETHGGQTDLQLLGSSFCWMFLPTANIAVVGLLISFAHSGSQGVAAWWSSLCELLQYLC
ncbi:MAG: M50 family metallopeptidase [Pirellulaceae bacterium]|nr:M50 family metallopeptidase [Pirellulaceae bacterium]